MALVSLPDKKYNTVVIDPPWPITMAGRFKNPRHHRPDRLPYPTMTLDEIKAVDIPSITNPGGHVYLWATNSYLKTAFQVLEEWGVRYHLTLVIIKPSGMAPSCGWVFGTEFCLLGFLGRPAQRFTRTGPLNWWRSPSRSGYHSTKPDAFYQEVELTSPGPRIDIFARRVRPGWDSVGDEIPHNHNLF